MTSVAHIRMVTILDAPQYYSAEQASAWAAGFNYAHELMNHAANELRSESAGDGAASASSTEEVRPQSSKESRNGQAEGSGAPEAKECSETVSGDGEEAPREVSDDRAQVLEGRER